MQLIANTFVLISQSENFETPTISRLHLSTHDEMFIEMVGGVKAANKLKDRKLINEFSDYITFSIQEVEAEYGKTICLDGEDYDALGEIEEMENEPEFDLGLVR